jgi:hypothetical protein
VEAIVLTPNQGELRIELKGESRSDAGSRYKAKRSPENGRLVVRIALIAGTCSQRYLQLWRGVNRLRDT